MSDNTSSISLASKYRPTSFATVVGQTHVVEVIRRAIVNGKVPKQILFSGRSGLGKTTIARIVAACIVCETPLHDRDRADSCGKCGSCLQVMSGTHPDIVEFDAASHGGKDEIRLIAERCQVLPAKANVKIYIIDEAHGLSHQGGQAFLKLLEQPPSHVLFMLCTTDPGKMLKTNRGRCVEFELLPPVYTDLVKILERIAKQESWTITPDVLDMVISAADPDLGVRGTVMSLAKIASILQDKTVSMEVIYSLLGVPSPLALAAMYKAIDDKDKQQALKSLDLARGMYSDQTLTKDLIRWATQRVKNSLGASKEHTDKALRELDTVLNGEGSGPWLDLMIAKLSSTNLSDPSIIQSMLERAKDMLTDLNAGLESAKPKAPISRNPGSTSVSDDMAKLLAVLGPASQDLVAIIKKCKVTLSPTQAHMVVPDAVAPAVVPHVAQLRSAAGKLGLTLKLTKDSSITS